MMVIRRVAHQARMALLWIAWLLLPTGCGGDGPGSELKVRPRPRPLGQAGARLIRLPQDEPFSIALAPSQQAAGLNGEASAEAHALREGRADATAEVRNGGSAQAGFQIGHAFENDSDRQIEMQVRVRCGMEMAAGADPPGPLPGAKVGLRLYARDGRNRLVRNIGLMEHATEDGAAASSERKDVAFELLLGPRESVSVFLAGSVQVETREGRSARGAIKLSGLEMEVRTEAAPPVGTAGDEQG